MKRRGYNPSDASVILKIGEALGINFKAQETIGEVENRDKASSFSSRTSRRAVMAMHRVRKPLFRFQYSKKKHLKGISGGFSLGTLGDWGLEKSGVPFEDSLENTRLMFYSFRILRRRNNPRRSSERYGA